MNPRERILALTLLGAVVLAGGAFIVYQFLWAPLRNRDFLRNDLANKIAAKEQAVAELEAKKKQIERWRALSLPGNVHLSHGEYAKHLNEIVAECGFAPGTVNVSPRPPDVNAGGRNKKQPYIKLSYELNGYGTLTSWVKLLDRFYKTPLLHQIKSVDLLKPQTPRPEVRPEQRAEVLDVKLKIEALIVEGAPSRTALVDKDKAPALPPLAANDRTYAHIAARNIFSAPPRVEAVEAPEVADNNRFIHLTDISRNGDSPPQGWLYDRLNKVNVRLRDEAGFNHFVLVADDDGSTVVRGAVAHIDDDNRDLFFRVELADKEDDGRRRDPKRLYRASCKELCQLADASLVPEGGDDRVYWVGREYWETLQKQGVVRADGGDIRFRYDLVRGKVIKSEGDNVFLLLEKKYCAYRAPGSREKPRTHEGFCRFHVGDNLLQALLDPIEPTKVEEIKGTAKAASKNN